MVINGFDCRPKQCADHPIKFYSRSDDQVQFKITPGLPDKQDRSKYVSFILLLFITILLLLCYFYYIHFIMLLLLYLFILFCFFYLLFDRKYASYIFHPFQPFIISVQHVLFQPPIVNFHFRHQRD